jgi:hypothetical protein
MVCLTAKPNSSTRDSDNVGDNPNLKAFVLEDRSLLDVQLEVGHMPGRVEAKDGVARKANLRARVRQRGAALINEPQCRLR